MPSTHLANAAPAAPPPSARTCARSGLIAISRPAPRPARINVDNVRVCKLRDHPNVISLCGACTTWPDLWLVLPFMPNGSLEDVRIGHSLSNCTCQSSVHTGVHRSQTSCPVLPPDVLLRMAPDAARGTTRTMSSK